MLCQVKEAIQAGVEKFRPGNLICDVDEAINKVAQKYGLSKGVWAGHSMGIDLGDGYNIENPIRWRRTKYDSDLPSQFAG